MFVRGKAKEEEMHQIKTRDHVLITDQLKSEKLIRLTHLSSILQLLLNYKKMLKVPAARSESKEDRRKDRQRLGMPLIANRFLI